MYLDAFTLAALTDELLDTIAGGRIQDVLDVDATGIGLEIYAQHKRHYLYLSADPVRPRVHLVEDRLRRGLPKATQVGLLLRRYAEGGSVTHVSQPRWERVLHIEISGPEGAVTLIIEPMERRSNLLLIRDGLILDCMRRVGPEENRVRISLPGQPYVPPPPQVGKLDPGLLTLQDVDDLLRSGSEPKRKAHQALTAHVLGFSPLLAREVVFRASGNADQRASDADPKLLLASAQSVVSPLLKRDWRPGIVQQDGAVSAFSVYPLQSLANWKRVGSASAALAAFYGAAVGSDAYKAAKAPVQEAISEAASKLGARLASLQRSMTDDTEREVLKRSGELILAYQYTIMPGQPELRAQYDTDQAELVIKLDPRLSALENAQHYFERYQKAKRALDDVPQRIEQTEAELDFLRQLAIDLELAASWPDIDEVQQELQSRGLWKGPSKRVPGVQKSAPLRVVTADGWVIWVGRNSRQNEQVTFEKGAAADLWLHARAVPGAHVIIKTEGRPAPEAVIERAAGLAAFYSARRTEAKVPVDVTARAFVRKIKGGAPGMVTYKNEQTRLAVPRGVGEQDV
jgi:predicted ribosome quality control (RQC) complex YloA/Tae2 family protein